MNSCSYVANDISWLLSASLDICVRRVGIEPTTPGFLAPYSTAELPSANWQGECRNAIRHSFSRCCSVAAHLLQYSPFNCCGRRIRTSHQELALAPPQRPPAIDKAHFSVVPVGTASVKTSGSPILSAVCAFYKIHFSLAKPFTLPTLVHSTSAR